MEASWYEIDEDRFFERFPGKPADAHKGTFGKILLICGGYGMAGAACLNIIGAKTLGASYLHVALPDTIYPIAASRFLTPVYHPFDQKNAIETLRSVLPQVRAVCFGSGAVQMPAKERILHFLLEQARVPLVLDAEALGLLSPAALDHRTCTAPLILTPHFGEFARLSGETAESAARDPLAHARRFAEAHGVIVALKGPNTVVASPDGRRYRNRSGNAALAQAGSGDVLTGLATAMLTFFSDPFEAACNAVWLHGHIADEGRKNHSCQCFPLEAFPKIMDRLFFVRGF